MGTGCWQKAFGPHSTGLSLGLLVPYDMAPGFPQREWSSCDLATEASHGHFCNILLLRSQLCSVGRTTQWSDMRKGGLLGAILRGPELGHLLAVTRAPS